MSAEQQTQTATPTDVPCDICGQNFKPGERRLEAGGEIVHPECVSHWFRSQWGRESLTS
jgi:hypothetical protein